jgi:hypothetical protein
MGRKKNNKVNEPPASYSRPRLRIYSSFEEQANAERIYMASLDPLERLRQMRQMINLAYGMHGPLKPPSRHNLRIISYKNIPK